jgi:hypothetical protein
VHQFSFAVVEICYPFDGSMGSPVAVERREFITLLGAAIPWSLAARAQRQSGASNPPALIEIVPNSGPAGPAYPLSATIRGTGFMREDNLVRFGPVTLPNLPSREGTEIVVSIPKVMPSGGEVPPLVLSPGEYDVTVGTSAGMSNALTFRLTPSP